MQDNTIQPINPFQESIPPAPIANTAPPISTSDGNMVPKPKSRFSSKVLAAIFGLILLIAGVIAGILLIRHQQLLNQGAEECVSNPSVTGAITNNCNHTVTGKKYQGAAPSGVTSDGQCVGYHQNQSEFSLDPGETFNPAPACGQCVQVDLDSGGGTAGYGECNEVKLKCTVVITGASPNQTLQVGDDVTLRVTVDNVSTNDSQNLSKVKKLNFLSTNTSAITVAPPSITGTNGGFVSQGTYNLTATAVASGTSNIRVGVDMVNCPTCGTTSNVCNAALALQVAGSTTSPTPTPTATATTTPTITPTPTPTTPPVLSCGSSCSSNGDCASAQMICSGNVCRNASCTNSATCVCATATPTPTATPQPSLPSAGVAWPTLIGIAAGMIVLMLGIILIL